ncbi:type II toxin-antitoxin system RelE family toxin [Streptomyces chattanoogensis]|uniref:type II toxin-antitoxin system RelE family toxin n=1 Tax=Streptomyces chattanoogensis TaxID=66876 RepID=UPI001FCA8D1D
MSNYGVSDNGATAYRTVFRPEARAELRKIPRDAALRILAKLTELEKDPYGFKTTALVSQPERRRLRVGDYRVVYTVDNGELVVWVVHIGHRSTVYGS